MIYDHPSSFLTDMGPEEPREEVRKKNKLQIRPTLYNKNFEIHLQKAMGSSPPHRRERLNAPSSSVVAEDGPLGLAGSDLEDQERRWSGDDSGGRKGKLMKLEIIIFTCRDPSSAI
jgi:hypothetical protein